MKIKALLLFAAFSVALPTHADFSGTVIRVLDGGRIVINTGEQDAVVNLKSIITAFPNQNLYYQSRTVFERIYLGRHVKVVTKDNLGSNCIYGEVYSNGVNLNEALLMTGFAWIFNDLEATDRYRQIEENNKATGNGLWKPEHHFHFNNIPLHPSTLKSTCISKSLEKVEEEDQYDFYNEKHRFSFSFWIKGVILGTVLGLATWSFLFWFDRLGVDVFKHFRRKKKKTKDQE